MNNQTTSDYEAFEEESPRNRRLLREEELILEVSETLCEALEREQVTRRELAVRLERSPGFVSQVLNGGRNLTLRTLADVADALGFMVQFRMVKDRVRLVDPAGASTASARVTQKAAEIAERALIRPRADAWATEMKTQAVVRTANRVPQQPDDATLCGVS